MKKHPYKPKFKALVRKAVGDYRRTLGFNHYDLKIEWFDEDTDAEDKRDRVLAQCQVDHRYLETKVKIYPSLERHWLKNDEEEVRRVIAHEIAHMATAHLWHIATATYKDEGEAHDAWEALTTIVGRLLFDLQKTSA